MSRVWATYSENRSTQADNNNNKNNKVLLFLN